jgi:hypothetical protein
MKEETRWREQVGGFLRDDIPEEDRALLCDVVKVLDTNKTLRTKFTNLYIISSCFNLQTGLLERLEHHFNLQTKRLEYLSSQNGGLLETIEYIGEQGLKASEALIEQLQKEATPFLKNSNFSQEKIDKAFKLLRKDTRNAIIDDAANAAENFSLPNRHHSGGDGGIGGR